jgi:mannosyltransferase
VLIVDGIIYSLQQHGGITVYFNELLQQAYAHGVACRTIVYEGAFTHAAALTGNVVKFKRRFAERYRHCSMPNDASLFHSSYYRLPDRPIPTVCTVHDFTYERFINGPRRWLHSWQKFDAIRKSQAIICISENTRSDLLHFLPDIPLERLHVVHNGVGDGFFPMDLRTDAEKDRPFVLFVGARGGYKNFSLVVETLARLPDLRLVSVGGSFLSANEAALVKKNLGSRFQHLAGISDQKLNKLYNRAYCLVYPSAYEGFGIPVLEAMKAGCPVIAFNGSSLPEVAGDAALLLDQLTTDALENAFYKLEEAKLRSNLSQKGLDRSKHFTWEKTFEETYRVYEGVRDATLSNVLDKF